MNNYHSSVKGNKPDPKHENLRTEYTALSNYCTLITGFRLTLLGFFVAAVGLMATVKGGLSIPLCLLGMVLTLSLYVFEHRTRILLHDLADRGIDIERNDWNLTAQDRKLPFFSRISRTKLEDYGELRARHRGRVEITILECIKFKVASKLVTHTFALDVLYLGVLAFFTYPVVAAIVTDLYDNDNFVLRVLLYLLRC